MTFREKQRLKFMVSVEDTFDVHSVKPRAAYGVLMERRDEVYRWLVFRILDTL